MTHKLQLSNGAARWLAVYLNQPGIFTTTANVFYIGVLLAGPLEPLLRMTNEELTGESWKTWSEGNFPLEISEGQRDAVKCGLSVLATKAILVPNKFTLEILETFGLKP